MKKRAAFLFAMSGIICAPAQTDWYHYDADGSTGDHEQLGEQVYQYDMNKYGQNPEAQGYLEAFAQQSAVYFYEDLNKGNIYRSFENKERYIRKVLNAVVVDTTTMENLRICFYRDEDINASMSESGLLRLNIGAMARFRNEAELAMLLGHEWGHFMGDDALKRYIRNRNPDARNGDWERSVKWKWYGLVTEYRPTYHFSRAQEESADLASALLLKHSPYSLKSASNLYRTFKREEIRNEIKNGIRSGLVRTHPDPGDRKNKITSMSADVSNAGKKDFFVDSVEFVKLKELCYMELVNMYFISNNLDELLNLSFSRYLFEPEHEQNLAVLIEALRRYILINEKTKKYNESFILNAYQSKRPEVLKNYAFLAQPAPSILDHLTKGLIDVWKEDTVSIKAKELLDPEILEFTSYLEAYDYFRKKAAENNSRIAEHYKCFGPEASQENIDAYRKINTIFLSNEYLSKRTDTMSSGQTVIILPFSSYHLLNNLRIRNVITEHRKLNTDFFEHLKQKQEEKKEVRNILKLEDLSFYEQHLLRSLSWLCMKELNLKPPVTYIKKSKASWSEANPELYRLFAKYNTRDLYICLPYRTRERGLVMFYCKITLPAKPGSEGTFAGIETEWEVGELMEGKIFANKISRELDFFIRKTE